MAVVPGSSDVFAQQKLADEKCTRTYIFHHNIASKSKENVQKLIVDQWKMLIDRIKRSFLGVFSTYF